MARYSSRASFCLPFWRYFSAFSRRFAMSAIGPGLRHQSVPGRGGPGRRWVHREEVAKTQGANGEACVLYAEDARGSNQGKALKAGFSALCGIGRGMPESAATHHGNESGLRRELSAGQMAMVAI